jgi:hypothetical protein
MNTDQFTPKVHAAIARRWRLLKQDFHTPKCKDCQKFHTVGTCGQYSSKYPVDVAKELLAFICMTVTILIIGGGVLATLIGLVTFFIGHLFGIIQNDVAPNWLVSASTVGVVSIGLLVWKFPKIFPALFPAPEPRERHPLVIEAENTLNELEALIHQRSQQEDRK